MQKKLDGKVVLLTGASRGLGKETAIYLSRLGAKLAICARSTDQLMETARLCEGAGKEVLPVTCDVTQYDQLKNLVEKTIERFGTVDVLINNANLETERRDFLDQTLDDLDAACHTGIFAIWHLMQLCFPYMKGKSSSIINFNAPDFVTGMPGHAAYTANKGAIRTLSMVVAREWGRHGIRVNTVSPNMSGTIYDKMQPEYQEWASIMARNCFRGKVGDPVKDFAPVIAFLASDESQWITGENINVDGGGNPLVL